MPDAAWHAKRRCGTGGRLMRHVITGANAATDPWPISEKNTVPPLSAKERESRINARNKRDYETVRM